MLQGSPVLRSCSCMQKPIDAAEDQFRIVLLDAHPVSHCDHTACSKPRVPHFSSMGSFCKSPTRKTADHVLAPSPGAGNTTTSYDMSGACP